MLSRCCRGAACAEECALRRAGVRWGGAWGWWGVRGVCVGVRVSRCRTARGGQVGSCGSPVPSTALALRAQGGPLLRVYPVCEPPFRFP